MADANHIELFMGNGLWGGSGGAGVTNVTVDANNDGWGTVFQPYSTDAITHLGFRYGSRTGTPPTFSIRLEGVDASGLPDNADVGGGSATAATFTPPADATWDGTWRWVALTNSYTPTRGQFLASTIRYSSGTIDASNNSSFGRLFQQLTQNAQNFPYALDLAAGAWTKRTTTLFGYRTASGRFGNIATATYSTVTANTAGHRSAMFFTLPAGWGSTYRVVGAFVCGKPAASTGSFKLCLWDSSWTELQAITVDGDNAQNPGGTNIPMRLLFDETSLTSLDFGTKYYIGYEVISGTVNVNGWTVTEAEDRQAFPNGLNRGLVTWNGVTTTETDTTVPTIGLIIDDITEPSGGGGLIIGPSGLIY